MQTLYFTVAVIALAGIVGYYLYQNKSDVPMEVEGVSEEEPEEPSQEL